MLDRMWRDLRHVIIKLLHVMNGTCGVSFELEADRQTDGRVDDLLCIECGEC